MSKSITSLGLDLSLTGTGVVILTDGKLVKQVLIKSKPVGDKPVDELKRIEKIVDEIHKATCSLTIDIAVIENLAFGVRNATSLTQLAGLNYFVRSMCLVTGIPFVLVAPTSLKKYVTGNGAAKKDAMLMETFKRWGVTMLNDNECDAYGLSQLGLALMGGNSKQTTKIQNEVVSLIKKQI